MEQLTLFRNTTTGLLHRWHLYDTNDTNLYTVIPGESQLIVLGRFEVTRQLHNDNHKRMIQAEYDAFVRENELREGE